MLMYQVDAFSDRVFGGNPAAVLVLERWPPDPLMQAIADENNLAETAFACPDGSPERWKLRWFSPVHEVDFCGHATLATAHVLFSRRPTTGPLRFSTRAGTLRVTRGEDGYRLDLPRFDPQPLTALPDALDGVFDRAPVAVFRNFENIFAELEDETAVRSFVPDLARIARLFPMGLAITAKGGAHDFVSRYFAPGAGIPEDPVTGSIHATLVPYWAERLGKPRLAAFQASRRGGRLACLLDGERVLIAGQAVTFMTAEIDLGDGAGF
nr:PhzF family phenazine biosynthesis protein [Nitratireductor alexandrii]